jgi:hypothetical protein
VRQVDLQNPIQLPGAKDKSQSRQSARSVSTQRSAKAFAFGALIGVQIT